MAGRFQDCIDEIMGAVGEGVINRDQAEELLDRIDERVKMRRAFNAVDDLDRQILGDAAKMAEENVLAAMIAKRNEVYNRLAENRVKAYIKNFKDPAEGLRAYMVGTVKLRKGGRLSIDTQGKAITMGAMGRLINELEKEGVWPLFTSGAIDREIARELWEAGNPKGKPGVSGNSHAMKIAKVVNEIQMSLVQRQNRAGAWIQPRADYIVRQSHDMDAVRRAGATPEEAYQNWRNFIIDKLDHEKTFGDKDPEMVLKGAFEGIISGVHLRSHGDVDGDAAHLFGFHGPSNLAKKISRPRLLVFKDADSWFNYNQEFGTKALHEAIIHGIEHASRNIALLEGFGTNPAAMFDKIRKEIIEENRMDQKVLAGAKSIELDANFKELDGTSRIAVHMGRAKAAATIRAVQNLSKLGSAVISSFSDTGSIASELAYQGQPLFKSYREILSGLFRGRGADWQKEVARKLGVGFEGMIGEVTSRFSVQDAVPGMMSKLTQHFFKWNSMNWWNDTHRTSVGLIMSNHYADMAGKAFGQLDEETARLFKLYNISEVDWDVMRAGKLTLENGYDYLFPDSARNAGDTAVHSLLAQSKLKDTPANRERVLDQFETKWRTFFTDRADFAIPTPGAAERSWLNLGTQPGTALGEAVRFFGQFKAFPYTMLNRGLGREIYGRGAESLKDALLMGNGSVLGLAHLIGSLTLFGYGAMVVKDIVKGRDPRSVLDKEGDIDPKVIFAAMAQGGGFGIYGDFLFGEFSRYGRSAVATLAGPTFGQFDDLAELYTRLRNGEDAAANFTRMVLNNTPFVNLFYTRAALDYLILYQLQETVNPGFLRRMESRILRENNQRFFIPPSSTIPTGGGDRLFEGVRQ